MQHILVVIYRRLDGFGDLVVSMLASGTHVCGFKPCRSRWIFTDVKILSMPSSGGEEGILQPLEMNEGTHSGKSTICFKAAML